MTARVMSTSDTKMRADVDGVLDFPEQLRAYLQRMRDDDLLHDVVFVVNNRRFPAHRCLVAAASPVLHSMLTNGMKETNQRDIVLKEVDVEAWSAVLDFMYTGRMNLLDEQSDFGMEKALRCLLCADWLQMEELVEVVSSRIARELSCKNCLDVLVAADRLSLERPRKAAMSTLVENFCEVWRYPGFLALPLDLVLEILRCGELVVRGEMDVFLAAVRWVVCSGDSGMPTATDVLIMEKTCCIIRDHTGLESYIPTLYISDVAETGTLGEVNYDALFECVDINEFCINDLQATAMICRKLCVEVEASRGISLPHVREFGESAVEKLIRSNASKTTIPVELCERVLHGRNDMVFAFSYRFRTAQLRQGGTWSRVKTPWFVDKRCNVKWRANIKPGGRTPTDSRHLGIYLRRSAKGQEKQEESEFRYLVYVEVGKNVFSRSTKTANTAKYRQGTGKGFCDVLPLSALEGEETFNVGAAIYLKAK